MVDIGPARFVQMAEDLGIGKVRQPVCARFWAPRTSIWSRWPPSIRPLRDGVRVDPVMVTRILNAEGTQLFERRRSQPPCSTRRSTTN